MFEEGVTFSIYTGGGGTVEGHATPGLFAINIRPRCCQGVELECCVLVRQKPTANFYHSGQGNSKSSQSPIQGHFGTITPTP